MTSTITFTASIALPAGGNITVQVDGAPLPTGDVYDIIGMLFEAMAEKLPFVPTPAIPKPEPAPELPPAATTAKPPKAKRGGGRPPAASGTCRHALAATLADAGGRWTGSASSLAETWVNRDSAKTEIRKMAAAGLIEQHQPNSRNVTAITLTAEGWKFIGRTPPASIGRPVAAVPDEAPAPKIPDLGPMERRPFDPDAVRQAQADAL